MGPKTLVTTTALYAVEGKAELVYGEIVLMSPTGGVPGRAGGIIYASLLQYERQQGTGYAFPDNVGFLVHLPHRQSFSPNAAWYVGELQDGDFLSRTTLVHDCGSSYLFWSRAGDG